MKEEDGFRVCADGSDKESPAVSCLGVDLRKAVHRSNGDESVCRTI